MEKYQKTIDVDNGKITDNGYRIHVSLKEEEWTDTWNTHVWNKHCATKIVVYFLCYQKILHAFHRISYNFLSAELETVPVPMLFSWLTTDPVSPFQRRSSSASSFHAFLLQVISDMMSLALCLQAMSKAPQHFRSSRHKISVYATLFSSIVIAYSNPHPNWFFPACPAICVYDDILRLAVFWIPVWEADLWIHLAWTHTE